MGGALTVTASGQECGLQLFGNWGIRSKQSNSNDASRLVTYLMNVLLTRAIELSDVGGVNFLAERRWRSNWYENCGCGLRVSLARSTYLLRASGHAGQVFPLLSRVADRDT